MIIRVIENKKDTVFEIDLKKADYVASVNEHSAEVAIMSPHGEVQLYTTDKEEIETLRKIIK